MHCNYFVTVNRTDPTAFAVYEQDVPSSKQQSNPFAIKCSHQNPNRGKSGGIIERTKQPPQKDRGIQAAVPKSHGSVPSNPLSSAGSTFSDWAGRPALFALHNRGIVALPLGGHPKTGQWWSLQNRPRDKCSGQEFLLLRCG